MKILWLAWKDIKHPQAGGAEVIMHQLSERLIADGHDVTILTALYPGAAAQDTIDGIHIIRVGSNRYVHSFAALFKYLRKMRNDYDLVIEVVNTAPYFGVMFPSRAKRFLFYHQLAREIWFHETSAPLSQIGYYLLEPIATFLLGKSRKPTITVSESTKQDLQRFGFSPAKIKIITEGIEMSPVPSLDAVKKYSQPTMLSLGAMRAMKQTLEQVEAFEIAKESLPRLRLKMAGDNTGDYAQEVKDYIAKSPYKNDIEVLGRVPTETKVELMQKCHLITVTSLKEGWGLIVSEAASQGTPAVVYDVDGLRDSVRDGKTGYVTNANPAALAEGIVRLLKDSEEYKTIRYNAWAWSHELTQENCYKDFKNVLEIA